jgi:hypothetical protein
MAIDGVQATSTFAAAELSSKHCVYNLDVWTGFRWDRRQLGNYPLNSQTNTIGGQTVTKVT